MPKSLLLDLDFAIYDSPDATLSMAPLTDEEAASVWCHVLVTPVTRRAQGIEAYGNNQGRQQGPRQCRTPNYCNVIPHASMPYVIPLTCVNSTWHFFSIRLLML